MVVILNLIHDLCANPIINLSNRIYKTFGCDVCRLCQNAGIKIPKFLRNVTNIFLNFVLQILRFNIHFVPRKICAGRRLKKNSRNFLVNREMRGKFSVIRPPIANFLIEIGMKLQGEIMAKFEILAPKSKFESEIKFSMS